MARNDYMREPVDMKALSSWTGREGKVRRNQIVTVPEWRARELEGYRRTTSRRMGIDGTRTEAGERYVGRPQAVRISKGQTKGGATIDDAHGRHDKPAPEVGEHGDHKPDSGGTGQAPPDTPEDGEGEDSPEAASQESVDATDGARDLAGTEGVDLALVAGTGAHGRVTKPDVEAFLVEREG